VRLPAWEVANTSVRPLHWRFTCSLLNPRRLAESAERSVADPIRNRLSKMLLARRRKIKLLVLPTTQVIKLHSNMWGKPGETQPTQNPSPQGNPAQGNPATASRPPGITSHSAKPEGPTIFGKSMKIIGDVSSDEELYVDGELEGKLDLKSRLTIGPESKVNANIKAKEVIVFGSVHGNVEAEERIALRAGATIVGDIKTAGIIIEDGAYFKGSIDISKTDTPKATQRASQAAAGDKR